MRAQTSRMGLDNGRGRVEALLNGIRSARGCNP
jgi:hypothetical protein